MLQRLRTTLFDHGNYESWRKKRMVACSTRRRMMTMMMMMMLGGKKSNAHWDRVLYTRRGGSMKRRDRDATLYPRGSEGKEYVAAKLRMGRKCALR